MELFGVCYIYGGNRFIEDIEMMIGKKSWVFWLYWRACWFFISPLLLTVRATVLQFFFRSRLNYDFVVQTVSSEEATKFLKTIIACVKYKKAGHKKVKVWPNRTLINY